MGDCIFCKIASKEIESEIVYENDNFLVFLDQNQEVPGHSLIVPKKHFVNTMDLPISLGTELLDAIKNTADKFLKEKDVEGFNILQNNFPVANQVVMHAHFHFFPRKKDDGAKIRS